MATKGFVAALTEEEIENLIPFEKPDGISGRQNWAK